MHRAHTFALAEDLTMTVLRMFLPQRKVHLGPVCLRQKGTAGASLVAREVWGLQEAAYLLLLELHPRNSAGLRPGFGKREHNQLRVALAESFLCSAEAAVHMFYIPSSRSLHSSITFGFHYYSTLEIPQLK